MLFRQFPHGWVVIALVCQACWPMIAAAADISPQGVRVGFQDHVVLGAWTYCAVQADITEPGKYRLEITATDPDGNLAAFAGTDVPLSPGSQELTGHFLLGRPDGVVTAKVTKDGVDWASVPLPRTDSTPRKLIPLTHAERLVITVGLPESGQSLFPAPAVEKRTVVHLADIAELPAEDWAYDGLAGLLLAGPSVPNEAQAAAINRWVLRGGRLAWSIGIPPKDFAANSLVKQFPFQVDSEPIPTRELTSLETYAGKTVRILPPGVRAMIPHLSYTDGKTLAGSRSELVLIQVPHGFGIVTLLGLDVTQSPLREWPGTGEILRKMTSTGEFAAAAVSKKQQFGSTGVSDLASQVLAALEHFETVSRTSPWWILGALALVMGLIGPLDYWVVSRLVGRPLATWVSFPVTLVVCTALAIWSANRSNGQQQLVNQLDVIDLDVASGFTRGRHWVSLFSPQAQAADVRIVPAWTGWAQESSKPEVALGWAGLPEASFGGMYRAGSGTIQLGQANYAVSAVDHSIRQLPVAQWSTATLSAVSQGTLTNIVESNLVSSATGRLSGTVTHRLPGPLTNWFLVYAGRIYRLPEGNSQDATLPFTPETVFRVNQPNVMQRELRGFLTHATARLVDQTVDKSSRPLEVQQANYDPLNRDLSGILPILSFHTEAGGTKHSKLANEMLPEFDLTPQMDLRRAVLFGYLEPLGAEVQIAGTANQPGRKTTLVRLVLPVDHSKQAARDMPIFDEKKK